MRYVLLVSAVALASAGAGYAKEPLEGVYLCTTVERAGVRSDHREGSGDPSAFVDDGLPTRFKMQIMPTDKAAKEYRLIELPMTAAIEIRPSGKTRTASCTPFTSEMVRIFTPWMARPS